MGRVLAKKVSPEPVDRVHSVSFAKTLDRIEGIDVARGIAILLMILSHTTKGLLPFDAFPEWGIVPVHAITKFSSTLFFMVFGMSLSLFVIPYCGTPEWPRRAGKLMLKGVWILLWYKILCVVQLFQTASKDEILDTLLFRKGVDFAEVLSFYGIILLWIPLILPMWKRLSFFFRLFLMVSLAISGVLLHEHFDFWNLPMLKALLVENEGHFSFGQFQRGAVVLLGMILGDGLRRENGSATAVMKLALQLFFASAFCFVIFYGYAQTVGENQYNLNHFLAAIARNFGKHPPRFNFMSFSLGGAFFLLGLSLVMGLWIRPLIRPLVLLGRHSLFAFIGHLIVVFLVYRYVLGLKSGKDQIDYSLALWLSLVNTLVVLYGIHVLETVKESRKWGAHQTGFHHGLLILISVAGVLFGTQVQGNQHQVLIGSPTDGCLVNGAYFHHRKRREFKNPFTTDYKWGHPIMIQFLDRLGKAYRKTFADFREFPILLGDVSRKGGGPLLPHQSHQTGTDVDLYFFNPLNQMADLVVTSEGVKDSFDSVRNAWIISWAAVQPETERVFVAPEVKLFLCENSHLWSSWSHAKDQTLDKVRPWFGHRDHLHVRLKVDGSAASDAILPDSCEESKTWLPDPEHTHSRYRLTYEPQTHNRNCFNPTPNALSYPMKSPKK